MAKLSNLLTLDADHVVLKPKKRAGHVKMILKGVDEDILVFSDRPFREADVLPTDQVVEHWEDIFKRKQPNSSFTIKDPESGKRSMFILETRNPRYTRKGNLIFDGVESKSQQEANKKLAGNHSGYKASRDPLTGVVRGKDLSLFVDNGFLGVGGCFFGHSSVEDSTIQIINNSGRPFDAAISYDGDWENSNQWQKETIASGESKQWTGSTCKDFDIGVDLSVNGIGGEDVAKALNRWIAMNPSMSEAWVSSSGLSGKDEGYSGSGTTTVGNISFPYIWNFDDDGTKNYQIIYSEATGPEGM